MHIHHPTTRSGDHGHSHSHSHTHTNEPHDHNQLDHDHEPLKRTSEKSRLIISIVVTGIVMMVEIIGGFLTNSIALLSDGAHMFTHAFALGISLVAIVLAAQKTTVSRTFGLYRAEVLASLFNSIFLFAVTIGIVKESIERLLHPEAIHTREMFYIAVLGLVVNGITIFILEGVSKNDRNIKSAFMHMIADAASSVGVVAGAIIIHFTNVTFIDPLLGMLISVLIAMWAWGLFKDAIRVLLEIAPRGMEIDKIKSVVQKHDARVLDISDMHVTEITTGLYNFTAHIQIAGNSVTESEDVITKVNDVLCKHYNIHHSTIQVYQQVSDHPHHRGNLE